VRFNAAMLLHFWRLGSPVCREATQFNTPLEPSVASLLQSGAPGSAGLSFQP
jgi:hypothetical protein